MLRDPLQVAGSPHLSDNTQSWHRGEYQPLRWTMEDIRAATKYTTTFASAPAPLPARVGPGVGQA